MIKSLFEKKGGMRILSKESLEFQNFIVKMNLVDTEMSTGLFTWNNKRGGESQLASKLERFMISEDLMITNKEIILEVLPFGGLDHWLVQLEIKGKCIPRNRPFRFENIWLSHPEFFNNIKNWWKKYLQIQGTRMFLIHKRLKYIKLKLKDWNINEFNNIFVEEKSVENKMKELNQALIKEGIDKDKSNQVDKYQQEWDNMCK